ncbi:MAG TPA: pitrilysin family protein, partial [Bacillota bacterium]|nr:pitrilysin family protein [Bacillota bacterium]
MNAAKMQNKSHFARRTRTGSGLLLLFGVALLGTTWAANTAPNTKNSPAPGGGKAVVKQLPGSGNKTPQVYKTVLPNGLTVLVKPGNANQVVAVDLFLNSGPLYEALNQRGISSLTQKVLIRGSQSRTAREVAVETESVGAQLSAGVSAEYAYVSLSTTVDGLAKGLEVFLDLLQHPAFSEVEIVKEKQMLVESLSAREDQPFDAAYLCFAKNFFAGHPLGVKTEDLVRAVQRLTREDLLAWYEKTYVPSNMVLSIVGNVDPDALLQQFQSTLGKRPRGKKPEITEVTAQLPAKNRAEYLPKNTNALFLVLGYPAPDTGSKDALVMDVINRILGGSSDGRLYMELREKRGLAYSVFTGYEKMNGRSNIYAIMATAPGNYFGARDGIVREFRRLTKETVP